jgi:hypothetical protein
MTSSEWRAELGAVVTAVVRIGALQGPSSLACHRTRCEPWAKEGKIPLHRNPENGYQRFKDQKHVAELVATAEKHGQPSDSLHAFVDGILSRMMFDGEQLTEHLAPLDLGWRTRTQKELALMGDLVPLLKKRANGRDISGLQVYEE